MDFCTCRDDVLEMIWKASAEFGSEYVLNRDQHKKIGDVCAYVDTLISESSAKCYDVSVDGVTKQFTISFTCEDMVLQHGRKHCFFKLISMLDSFSFEKKGEDLCVSMNIDSMWVAADGC